MEKKWTYLEDYIIAKVLVDNQFSDKKITDFLKYDTLEQKYKNNDLKFNEKIYEQIVARFDSFTAIVSDLKGKAKYDLNNYPETLRQFVDILTKVMKKAKFEIEDKQTRNKKIDEYINNVDNVLIKYYSEKEQAKNKNKELDMNSFSDEEKVIVNNYIVDGFDSFKEKSFMSVLYDLMDKKDLFDSDVYKAVHIDRRHYSKIKMNNKPTRDVAIRLCFGVKANLQEANLLMKAAGYDFDNSKRDYIIRYGLEHGYSFDDTNCTLYDYDLELLFE